MTALVLALNLLGCSSKAESTISLGAWISLINETAEIPAGESTEPYFLNITAGSLYYEDVQAAVEWNIIDPAWPLDPDAPLTREWAAYTLMNLAGKAGEQASAKITDLGKSQFPDHVQSAVSSGLMNLDKRNLFRPLETLSREEAVNLLDQVVSYINNRTLEDTAEIVWTEETELLEPEVMVYDSENETAVIVRDDSVVEGSLIHFTDMSGIDLFRIVDSVQVGEEGMRLVLSEPDVSEMAEEIHISGERDVDFSGAAVTLPDGSTLEGTGYVSGLINMSSVPLTKSFTAAGGYTVTLTVSGSSISAKAVKKLDNGLNIEGKLSLSGLKAAYDMDFENHQLDNGYFRMSFNTLESLSAVNSSYKKMYGDFSEIDPSDFLSSLKGIWHSKKSDAVSVIPLCTITLPVEGTGAVALTGNLELLVNATGKAQLAFSQSNTAGFELRNGKVRPIHSSEGKDNSSIRASAKVLGGVSLGLTVLNQRMMDAGISAGMEASAKAMVHLYDDEQNHTVSDTEIDADLVEEMADGNPDVLVCADLSGAWLLNLTCNSSASLAGRLGLSGTYKVLQGDNAKIIPSLCGHFENGQKVDRCTRGEREKKQEKEEELKVTKKITLTRYSMIVRIGEPKGINVTGLPEGYDLNDLVYEVNDSSIASVSLNGTVTALNSGSTYVTIRTADGDHSIQCHILVPQTTAS